MAEKKKPAFSIASLLNENTLAQADNRSKKIAYEKLIPHEKNHYELSDIEKLAATIEQFGVLQPLMVKPITGTDTYRIISGHRRHASVALLVERDGLDNLKEIPCYIIDEDEDEILTEIKLHISNTTARELSEHDKMVAIVELKRLIQQAKDRDLSIKGKMRELIAESMNLGTTQVQKYLSIGEQASDEIKNALRDGDITVQEAYETTKKTNNKNNFGEDDADEMDDASVSDQKPHIASIIDKTENITTDAENHLVQATHEPQDPSMEVMTHEDKQKQESIITEEDLEFEIAWRKELIKRLIYPRRQLYKEQDKTKKEATVMVIDAAAAELQTFIDRLDAEIRSLEQEKLSKEAAKKIINNMSILY
jgi:ParB-like chromosome segregation protein Spo0J